MEPVAPRDGALLSGWLNRPLCRRYALGIFDVAAVRWRDADGSRERAVHWGLGWLPDGECDFLGAWLEPEPASDGPRRLFADLQARGVERVRRVAGTAVSRYPERASAAFPGTTVEPSFEGILADAVAGSHAGGRPSPTRLSEQVRAGLSQALRQRRGFESEPAVLDFFARALQRMERRLDRGGLMATRKSRLDPRAPAVASS